jgi:hypothetical protein
LVLRSIDPLGQLLRDTTASPILPGFFGELERRAEAG